MRVSLEVTLSFSINVYIEVTDAMLIKFKERESLKAWAKPACFVQSWPTANNISIVSVLYI